MQSIMMVAANAGIFSKPLEMNLFLYIKSMGEGN